YARAGGFVRWNVNLETVFRGIPGASHQNVGKPAQLTPRDPIKFHRAQIGVGQLLKEIDGFRALDCNLREIVGEILDSTVETARVVAHPVEVLLARARVDHQKVFVFAQAVNDDIVDERSFGIEQGRVLSLSDRQL